MSFEKDRNCDAWGMIFFDFENKKQTKISFKRMKVSNKKMRVYTQLQNGTYIFFEKKNIFENFWATCLNIDLIEIADNSQYRLVFRLILFFKNWAKERNNPK